MLKLKLQYFGHLLQRADSLEKTLMLGGIGGRRRRGRQRIKESQSLRDIEISVCQGVSKTTLKLLCSQMQLGKGTQLKSAKGKVLGAKTRRDQVQAPKWCLPVELPGAMELLQQYHVATGMKCCPVSPSKTQEQGSLVP